MSRAAIAAAIAGAAGVLGAWEALAIAERARWTDALRSALAPLLAAGRDGRRPSGADRRRLALLGTAVLLAAGWLLWGLAIGALGALCGPWVARGVVRSRRRRWRAQLEAAAPAVARAVADGLGAGHALRGALALASEHVDVPAAARELRDASTALALGARTDDVLERLRDRAGCASWETLIAAMLLHRRAGGDLARQLRAIAARQEQGLRELADARAATAQARFTAQVVVVMPVGAAVLSELVRPGSTAELLAHPASALALLVALGGQALAFVAIRRIARLEA